VDGRTNFLPWGGNVAWEKGEEWREKWSRPFTGKNLRREGGKGTQGNQAQNRLR